MKQFLLVLPVCVFSLAPILAQDATPDTTLTITVTGTLSLISGPDCLGANGEPASATVMISESATPTSATASSAIYKIPAGGVSATVGSTTFTSAKPWAMQIVLEPAHGLLVLSGPGPLDTTIKIIGKLKSDHWTSAVLLHPEPFSPSPRTQPLSGGTLQYAAPRVCGGATVLGLAGGISNSAASSELPADDSSAQ
jgi:hypothetical protein